MFEKLANVRQEGEIEEYIEEFEMLVGQATKLMEELLMEYFFKGLHSNIRSQIRSHSPKDLLRVVEVVRDVEEVLKEIRIGMNQEVPIMLMEDIKVVIKVVEV